jgi:hypothetical protein
VACSFFLACGGNTKRNDQEPPPPAAGGQAGVSNAGSKGGTSSSGGKTSIPEAGTAPVTGGDASSSGEAGQGGATAEPCGGIAPRCVPGEAVCHPKLGKRTTCDDCGQPLPGGVDDCVRLLASDKESDGFCVVRGETSLECWHLWDKPMPRAIPKGVVDVLMADDSSSVQPDQLPCLEREAGNYSCVKEAGDCGGAPIGQVAVGDYGACGLCAGKLHCEGEVSMPESLPPSLVDVTVTDNSAFVLSDLGVQTFGLPTLGVPAWKGKPARLAVDHMLNGCVVSDLDELACWTTFDDLLVPSPWRGSYRKLVPTTIPAVCVLDDARQVSCGNVFDDAAPQPLGASDAVDFVASNSVMCSLSADGHVACWKSVDMGAPEPLEVPIGW